MVIFIANENNLSIRADDINKIKNYLKNFFKTNFLKIIQTKNKKLRNYFI